MSRSRVPSRSPLRTPLGAHLTTFCNVSAENRRKLYGFVADYMGFVSYAAGTVKTVPYIGGELRCGGHTATWCVGEGTGSPSQTRKAGGYYVHSAVRFASALRRLGFEMCPRQLRLFRFASLLPEGELWNGAYSAGWFIIENAVSPSLSRQSRDSSPKVGALER